VYFLIDIRASAPDIRFNNLELILYSLIRYLLYTFIYASHILNYLAPPMFDVLILTCKNLK